MALRSRGSRTGSVLLAEPSGLVSLRDRDRIALPLHLLWITATNGCIRIRDSNRTSESSYDIEVPKNAHTLFA